jgi:branched-chain amino acid transport system substrate-binding protein
MGIEVVHFEIFPLDLSDYNSLLLKVKRQNPDLLLVGGLFSQALRVMKAAKEVDFTPKGLAFSYGPTVPEFLKEFGKDAEGVIAASEWLPSFRSRTPVRSASGFAERHPRSTATPPDYVQAAGGAGSWPSRRPSRRSGSRPRSPRRTARRSWPNCTGKTSRRCTGR